MSNLHTVLGTNNCSVWCRVKVTLSHGRGLLVHGAAHTPWLSHPSAQTMCTHRANQYQPRGKARPIQGSNVPSGKSSSISTVMITAFGNGIKARVCWERFVSGGHWQDLGSPVQSKKSSDQATPMQPQRQGLVPVPVPRWHMLIQEEAACSF